MSSITDWPIEERPRERLISQGAGALSDAELLAVCLRTGSAGCSAVDLGRELIRRFGGLAGLLAAERYRTRVGEGQLVKVSLTDVAFAMVANLGYLAQAQLTHEERNQIGNDLYGAFGRDFATANIEFVRTAPAIGRQSQTWVRFPEGWRIVAAHVSVIDDPA